MGKSEEKKTKKRAHKATAESRSKNKTSFDATTFEAADDEKTCHSRWRDFFRQLCEYKAQFGNCIVPRKYAASPKLGQWLSKQRSTYRKHQERRRTSMPEERIRELESIGFVWETTSDWFGIPHLERIISQYSGTLFLFLNQLLTTFDSDHRMTIRRTTTMLPHSSREWCQGIGDTMSQAIQYALHSCYCFLPASLLLSDMFFRKECWHIGHPPSSLRAKVNSNDLINRIALIGVNPGYYFRAL